jgi:tetratricopeptide (TPR) repeat protein
VKPKSKLNLKITKIKSTLSKTTVQSSSGSQNLFKQAWDLHLKGQWALAQIAYEQVLAIEPLHFDALHMLGVLANQTQQPEKAVERIQQAIQVNPNVAGAYSNLGLAFRQLQQFEEALACYDQALILEPLDTSTLVNRGVALRGLYRYGEALESYTTALSLQPNLAQAYYNRGLVKNDLNQLQQAIEDFDAVVSITPGFHPAMWAKALCLLQLGRFSEAWPLYTMRWLQDEKEFTSKKLHTVVPEWKPQVPVARLLVWPEQGVGDEIMFGALLQQAQQLCQQLLVQMDPRLIALFQGTMPRITFLPKYQVIDESLYDAQLPMGDLLPICIKDSESFLSIATSYIQADPARAQALRQALSKDGKRLCGISWRSKNLKKGKDRSIPLKEMLLVLNHPTIQFVNLQYGDVDEELAQVQQELGIEVKQCDEVDNQNDLEGLAALIQACDVVISADNSTVHLAGALGKSVWVLLPFNADWRWFLDRDNSPWYPSARLFRQKQNADWAPVLSNVADALKQITFSQ